MGRQIQKSEEFDDFDERIIISNQLHKNTENTGTVINQCIVPKIRVHGMIIENESTSFNSSDLDYNTVYKSSFLESNKKPFISTDTNCRQYNYDIIYKYKEVNEFSDILNLDSKEFFIVNSSDEDKVYYICSVKYDLVGDFSVDSGIYKQKILYDQYDDIDDVFRSTFTDLNSVEYEFKSDGLLKIRKRTNNWLDIPPEKFEKIFLKSIKYSFGTLLISSLIGVFKPMIAMYPLILSIVSLFIIFSISTYYTGIVSQWKYPEGKYHEDKNYLSYTIHEIRRMYNNSSKITNNVYKSNKNRIKLVDGNLVSNNTDITWTIYNNSYDIYEQRAIKFFKDMGFESIQKEFTATVIPNEDLDQYDCNVLISDDGEYAMLANNKQI